MRSVILKIVIMVVLDLALVNEALTKFKYQKFDSNKGHFKLPNHLVLEFRVTKRKSCLKQVFQFFTWSLNPSIIFVA